MPLPLKEIQMLWWMDGLEKGEIEVHEYWGGRF
jgi:hypothetical protein